MIDNLLNHGLLSVNESVGNVALNYTDIKHLIDYSITPICTLVSGSKICFDIDFADRVAVDKIKYYFNEASTTISGAELLEAVKDSIVFEYKNNDFESFNIIETYFEDNYYYATSVSTSTLAPRQIRVTQDLTNVTTFSGTVHGLVVSNNTDLVDFGTTGDVVDKSISAIKGEAVFNSLPIYNNSIYHADAFVQVVPKHIYLDEYVYISNNQEGPWKAILDESNVIMNHSNFTDGIVGDNATIQFDAVTITGEIDEYTEKWASCYHYAIYTTIIFKTTDLHYSNLVVKNDTANVFTRVCVDPDDTTDTFYVRYSRDLKPYYAYRTLYMKYIDTYTYHLCFRDVSIIDNSSDIYNDSDNYVWDIDPAATTKDFYICYNHNTEWCVHIVNVYRSNYSDTYIRLFITDPKNYIFKNIDILSVSAGMKLHVYRIEMDLSNGFWVYLHTNAGSSSYELDDPGYYFMHFDIDLNVTFKYFSTERPIFDFSINKNTDTVWYTDRASGYLRHIDSTGNILNEYRVLDYDEHGLKLDSLAGCATDFDDNCWFINAQTLTKISTTGEILDTINFDALGIGGVLSTVSVYDNNNIVVRSSNYIVKINVDKNSSEYGKVQYSNYIYNSDLITVTPDKGVWVYCLTGISYFISNDTGDVLYTIGELISNKRCIPGYIMKTIEESEYKNNYPILNDNIWWRLPYNKVDSFNYYLPTDFYNQVKIVLRVNEPHNKYNVPKYVTAWDTNDDFNTEVGYDKPYEHRWQTHNAVYTDYVSTTFAIVSGTSNFEGNVCVFPGDPNTIGNIYQYIESKDKWYIKENSDAGNYDFQFDYIIPASTTEDFELRFKVMPTYHYDSSMMSCYLKRVSGMYYIGYYMAGYESNLWTRFNSYTNEVEITDVFVGSGTIRMRHSGSVVYIYLYDGDINDWVQYYAFNLNAGVNWSQNINFGSHWPNFYVKIDCKCAKPIYITNFLENTAEVWWFFNAPRISKIYISDAVKLENIYPSNYKNLYIKTDIPKNVAYIPEEIQEYDLRAWWESY